MRQGLALWVLMLACALGEVQAAEKDKELASLAGDWLAESYVRSGQRQADKDRLKALTLEIKGDRWTQNFGGDIAPYEIRPDVTRGPKALILKHLKVNAERKCLYALEGDRLTVIEQVGEPGDDVITVWRRKPKEAK